MSPIPIRLLINIVSRNSLLAQSVLQNKVSPIPSLTPQGFPNLTESCRCFSRRRRAPIPLILYQTTPPMGPEAKHPAVLFRCLDGRQQGDRVWKQSTVGPQPRRLQARGRGLYMRFCSTGASFLRRRPISIQRQYTLWSRPSPRGISGQGWLICAVVWNQN